MRLAPEQLSERRKRILDGLLKYGLALILMLIGVKMLLLDLYKIPVLVALGLVALILAASVVGSLAFPAAPARR